MARLHQMVQRVTFTAVKAMTRNLLTRTVHEEENPECS
jgi:hypothetical protein